MANFAKQEKQQDSMQKITRYFRRILTICLLLVLAAGTASGQDEQRGEFCRMDGRIETDSSIMRTAEWRTRIVHEFLKYAATPGDINSIDYCDSYRSVMMADSTCVSIDCVTFPSCDIALAKWLNDIPDSTYIEPDIPAEAPERCIAFRKSSTLVIVWCNLFADSDKVFRRVDEYLYGNQLFQSISANTHLPIHDGNITKVLFVI